MSVDPVTGGHARVCDLGRHLGSHWCPRAKRPRRGMLIWVAFMATWSHGDNLAPVTSGDHVLVHDPAAAGVCSDVCGLC